MSIMDYLNTFASGQSIIVDGFSDKIVDLGTVFGVGKPQMLENSDINFTFYVSDVVGAGGVDVELLTADAVNAAKTQLVTPVVIGKWTISNEALVNNNGNVKLVQKVSGASQYLQVRTTKAGVVTAGVYSATLQLDAQNSTY